MLNKANLSAFNIPYSIGMLQFAKALSNLGETINLIPYVLTKQLGWGQPKSTTIRLLMADRSIKHPFCIFYDIFVNLNRFIFLADFVFLTRRLTSRYLFFLGRPFFATSRALLDVGICEFNF